MSHYVLANVEIKSSVTSFTRRLICDEHMGIWLEITRYWCRNCSMCEARKHWALQWGLPIHEMNFLGKSEYAFLGTVDAIDKTKNMEQILVGIMRYEKPRIFTSTAELLENLKTKDGGTLEFIELKDYLEQQIGRKVVLRRPT